MKGSSSAIKTLRIIEATIGAFFTFALGFALVVASFLLGNAAWQDGRHWVVLPFVILDGLELWFLYRLKVALEEGHYPFSPYFAMQHDRWPLLLRPGVACWWLAHFAAGIGACIVVDNLLVYNVTDWNTRVLRSMLFIVVSFTIAYSTNLYLLLTVTAIGWGKQAVDRIWRFRVALDLIVAITAAFFPIISPQDPETERTPQFPSDLRRHPPSTQPKPAASGSAGVDKFPLYWQPKH